jgi:threonine aldolase
VEPAANEVFTVLSRAADERLRAAGAVYHPWPADSIAPDRRPRDGEVMVRLVTSWRTKPSEIDRFTLEL